MKKITRINLDQISREFTPLSKEMQQEIKGGDNVSNNCVMQAITLASSQIGCSVNMNAVTDRMCEMLIEGGYGPKDKASAIAYRDLLGLPESVARGLINEVFTDIAEGSCGNGSSTIAFVTISGNVKHAVVQVKDDKGNICYQDSSGMRFYSKDYEIQVFGSVSYVSDGYYNKNY